MRSVVERRVFIIERRHEPAGNATYRCQQTRIVDVAPRLARLFFLAAPAVFDRFQVANFAT